MIEEIIDMFNQKNKQIKRRPQKRCNQTYKSSC